MDVDDGTSLNPILIDSADALGVAFARDPENSAVCIVDGHGISIGTASGRLKVSDGIGTHRRERIYSRANHGLARLVVLGTSGTLSIEAVRWLDGAGIPWTVIDSSSGVVLSTSTSMANDDARIRRAQALCPGTDTGRSIAIYLTALKLTGQTAIALDQLGAKATADTITHMASRLDDSSTLEEIRQIEASAANLYWAAWGSVQAQFVAKDAKRVPSNWMTFEGRRSALNPGSAKNASDPINALLNYTYRLLEAEGHLATLAVGLDPGLGVLHADTKGRASFVLDLIEATRPMAELHILRLLRSQPLRWRDFNEDSRGVVRVLPPLTHRLAEAMPGFATSLAPVVERIAHIVAKASPYDVATPSILTKEKHKAAARRRVDGSSQQEPSSMASVGPGAIGLAPRTKQRQRPRPENEPALPLPICRGCGVILCVIIESRVL
jgi:CRISPR-associated endonuclease Cas1